MADLAKILGEALTLPPRDRTMVIVRLLESLDEAAEDEVGLAWESEIQRRVAEVRAGTSNSVPLDEALRRLDEVVDA